MNYTPFIPSWNMTEGEKNLMLLSAHLWDADARHLAANEPTYDQLEEVHACGTPACAIGHARALFKSSLNDRYVRIWRNASLIVAGEQLFELDYLADRRYAEWDELFSTLGCGYARSAREAAVYIRGFVRRKLAARNWQPLS